MKYISLLVYFSISIHCFSQTETPVLDSIPMIDSVPVVINPWEVKILFGVNGSQTSFVNWSSGGRNNVSVLGFLDFNAKYRKGLIKWDSDFKFALGGLRYIDSSGKSDGLQKTDDRIDIASSFGYEFKKKWFYTITGGFKTQSLDGFSFPNDSVRISAFLAPAYINLSLGIEYAPVPSFNMYLSPLAGKITIVNDLVLANDGAFGVEKAIRDTSGNVLKNGERVRYEFGSYFRVKFQKEVMKNIEVSTRVELFSNYFKNPQNVDVNAENIVTFKVNKLFSASLQWNFQYDDDIDVRDRKGNTGPRAQFKSVLGLGISYTMTN